MRIPSSRHWAAKIEIGASFGAHVDVDCLPVGVGLLDNEFRFRRFNRAYADYLTANTRYSAGEAIGLSYFGCIDGARAKAEPLMRHVLASGTPYELRREELAIRVGDRTVVTYWDGQISPVIERSGHVSGILLVCTEITELRSEQPRQDCRAPLTFKEEQVAALICEGLTSKEIADRLCLTKAAIDARRNVIRKKLGISGSQANLYGCLKQLN
ncbi:helix-turn-helix transcriptional regulator [Microbaculum marinum]|uniref:PAS domain-containing protein n=1 Tax=Microbaculum marinum TaxID=1764581 RepID=A0AAW9RD28_9HYPH